jgi:CubicO group peptidase (beta-lactamase class C family)
MAFLKRSQSRTKASPASCLAGIDDYISSQIAANGPGLALAIIAGGSIIHASAYGLANAVKGQPIQEDTIFHFGSCGKQFTGLGILMLAEEGKLDLDDPIGEHIPLIAGFGPRVTVRRLLHHSSGIRDLYDEHGVKQLLARPAPPTNADLIRTYADLGCPMAATEIEPGERFSYSNSGYELLGSVIEEVSGQSYHDFFERRVFDPLKMRDTFSIPDPRTSSVRAATGYIRDNSGHLIEAGATGLDNLVGSGSFYTSLPDLCRYDQALRTNCLVSAANLEEAFTSGRMNDGSPANYGFGWFLTVQNDISLAYHEGGWNGCRSFMCYCLDRPLSIYMLSNHPEVDLFAIARTALTPSLGDL